MLVYSDDPRTVGVFARGLALSAVVMFLSGVVPGAAALECKSTQEMGARRGCIDTIAKANTSAECEALCCASSAANPIPVAGVPSEGCVAWFHNQFSQCFMCNGAKDGRSKPVPPVNKTYCHAEPTGKVCMTGLVKPTVAPQPPPAPRIIPGIGAEGSVEYVNAARGMLPPVYANGSSIQLNRSTELTPEGWPLMDCQIVIFDERPTHAWAPPMDDPSHRQDDYSGDWTLVLEGNATVSLVQPTGITLGTPRYEPSNNTLTQIITFAKGGYPAVQNLLILRFTDTRALPSSPPAPNGTGFRNLRVYRPGYGPNSGKSDQLFTDRWAALMSIFSRVRWMGATGTNGYNWRCAPPNAAACSVVQWHERHIPDMAFYNEPNLPAGAFPFEHVVLAANELNSDVWINVPLQASSPTVCRSDPDGDHTKCIDDSPESTFEYQLALLLRDGNNFTGNVGLKPHLKIYVEHGNEVWNYGFRATAMNQNFADWEVLNSSKRTNLDKQVRGRPDIEQRQHCTNHTAGSACWAKRLHARRVYEISQTFEKVFGTGSLNNRVRMVYASWGLQHNFQTYFNDTLYWLQAEYGPVNNFLYAISYAQYFGPHSQNEAGGQPFNYSTATIPQVLQAFDNATSDAVLMTIQFVDLAKAFGVKTVSYEGGPGYRVGGEKPGSKGLNTMMVAARDPGMKDVVKQNVDTCYRFGWDEYQYFSAAGKYSEYGCWGATEFFSDIDPGPPKLQALYELTGHRPKDRAEWAADVARPRARVF